MSTHSTIAFQTKKGTIKAIYCHFDGCITKVGKMLLSNYMDKNKTKELISLGAISYLAQHVRPSGFKEHNFDNPEKDITVAYHRDRGDSLSIMKFKYMEDYMKNLPREDYNYIYMDKWWYLCVGNSLIPLTFELVNKLE